MSVFKQAFKQKQLQNLSLSYSMKLSLQLLQLNSLQLKEYLEKELVENPMFEVDMPMNFSSASEDSTWDIADNTASLYDELRLQINTTKINLILLEGILHNCDRNGYLRVSAADIATQYHVPEKEVTACLACIHACEPYGIAAHNLSECLAIQVEHRYPENCLLLHLVRYHLEDIAKNYLEKLANKYQVEQQQIKDNIALIQTLDPRPGSSYDLETIMFVKADILLDIMDHELTIIMPNYFNIKENEYYKGYSLGKEEKDFIREKRAQGKAILECLQHRKKTLHAIMHVMIEVQKPYLLHSGPLQYLRMIDIAERLAMHETTISRAMKDKYYEYEGQVLPMHTLLCKQLHETSVDKIITTVKELIDKEDKQAPLSDQKLSDALKQKDILCSRRTVAKYRMDHRIPSASTRKRLKEKSHE